MRIKITSDARVLLPVGTVVDVDKATAETIIRLGKALPEEETEKQTPKRKKKG